MGVVVVVKVHVVAKWVVLLVWVGGLRVLFHVSKKELVNFLRVENGTADLDQFLLRVILARTEAWST